MIKKLLLILVFSGCCAVYGQTIKTDVLVIGNGPCAVAAAIQSARSKVKTVLMAEKIMLSSENEKLVIEENLRIPSGIWGEFRNHVKDFYKTTPGFDTTFNTPLHLSKTDGDAVLLKMADTVKKLTIVLNAVFVTIEKSGDEWDVKVLKDGKPEEIKARVIVDATEGGIVTDKAGGKAGNKIGLRQVHDSNLFRTAIAAGETWPPQRPEENTIYSYWFIPLKAILASRVENILAPQAVLPAGKDANYLPVQLQAGQGAGATAAYCAFFKTSTAHLNVRIIQGELFDFKADLVPFMDVSAADHDWRQIEQVSVTGLLGGLGFFAPDQPVTTASLRPVLQEIYTRAFLWFNREKPGEKFTIGNTLSFISDYTLTDPAILKSTIQRNWQTQFKFKSDFDLNRPITRREFAVLANKYLNPFARTVDLNGRFVN